jgi:hypothetical protein
MPWPARFIFIDADVPFRSSLRVVEFVYCRCDPRLMFLLLKSNLALRVNSVRCHVALNRAGITGGPIRIDRPNCSRTKAIRSWFCYGHWRCCLSRKGVAH